MATEDIENLEAALELARQARRTIAKQIATGSADESAFDRLYRAQETCGAIQDALDDEHEQSESNEEIEEDDD